MPCAIVLSISATQIQSLFRGYLLRSFLKLLQPNWPAVACNPIDPITLDPFPSTWTMHIKENEQLFQFSLSTLMCQVPTPMQSNPFTRIPFDVGHIRHRIQKMVKLRDLPLLHSLNQHLDWSYMKHQNMKPQNKRVETILFMRRRRVIITYHNPES